MIPEFERYRSEIEGLKSPPVLGDKAFYERSDLINENFRIFTDGKLSAYYASFDYINRKARVVLVGLTPGWTQMERAYRTAKRSIAEGLSGDELLRSIKTSASFSGAMRKNLVSMLDGIELNQHLQLLSCG
jgi:hypothetical protein